MKVRQLALFTVETFDCIYEGREALATVCYFWDGRSQVLDIQFTSGG